MRQLQKVSPQHAAKRGQAASLLLAALLLLALLISGKSSNGAGWREQWLLSALRLNTSRHGAPAAPTACPDAGGPGLALAQEKQGVEVDVIVVVENQDQQAQAADARQQLQDARAGSQPKAATPADAPRPQDRQQRCAVYNGVSCCPSMAGSYSDTSLKLHLLCSVLQSQSMQACFTAWKPGLLVPLPNWLQALFHSDVAAGMAWAFQVSCLPLKRCMHSTGAAA